MDTVRYAGYFIIGMGTGVGFHRYFSHKKYETYPWVCLFTRRSRFHVLPRARS